MRILVVTNDYPPKPGGIQQYLGNLVAQLPAEITVLAPHDPKAADEPGVVRNERTFMWPTREVGEWIRSAIDEYQADVLLFGAPHPLPLLGARLRAATGVPIAVLAHGAEVTLPAAFPGARRLLVRALRAADAVFAVSRFTVARVESLTRRPATYVGGGVDPEVFVPASPQPDNDPPIVGCVGRFVPRKGQERLIEAAARLDRPVEVLFVGRGRREVALRTLAADLGVTTRFAVDVPWSQLPGLYREMDVFCMPASSRWAGLEAEGLGLVYLEAAACGLPVLAGDSGGSPETVVPGETGFVATDVPAIVEGLHLLLGDPGKARSMGAAGRERVLREFTWPVVADRFMSVLERVAAV